MVNFLTIVGAITLLSAVVRSALFIYHYTAPSQLGRYLKTSEPWALVTGIGLGFANELAHRGFNVIIHGRNAAKLQKIQADLEAKYPDRKFQTLVLDAGHINLDEIRKLHYSKLAVLINNVGGGMGQQQYNHFLNRSLEEVADMMSTNATFASVLTRQLLPQLRRPGLIINVGSVVADWPIAGLEPYSGAKGHNRSFSEALRMEMKMLGQDVEVMHLRVFSVATKTSMEQQSVLIPSPRAMAKAALDRVGNGSASTVGFMRQAIVIWLLELMPRQMIGSLLSKSTAQKMAKT